MIEISDKSKCTGCGACISICPQKAICFVEDEEGVKYPCVDKELCNDCDCCNSVCPFMSDAHGNNNDSKNIKYFAGQLKNLDELINVSSGGAFWAIAKSFIDNNGIVYGVKQTDVDIVKHYRAVEISDVKEFCRSKYLQSDCSDMFNLVKKDLLDGHKVFFSGTGCQIAGLNMFLKRKYENLTTCEVVCHGVPCGNVWKSFRDELERNKSKKLKSIIFRDKSIGWSNNRYKLEYNDGTIEYELSINQAFHKGYLMGLFYRPSCGNCMFAKVPRVSDITLADYWKYKGKFSNNGDKGISLIVVNSCNGLKAVNDAEKYLNLEETTEEEANNSCRHLNNSPETHPDRDEFIRSVNKYGYFKSYDTYILSDSVFHKMINKIIGFFR